MINFLIDAFNLVLYQPLFNALILLYQYFPGKDFGIAVIVLTLLIKFLLYPLGTQTIKAQKRLAEVQPKVEQIQKQYKNDREKLVKATLDLYKKEKIKPFSGFLPLLIQLPILIALFQLFWRGFGAEQMSQLYSFLTQPGHIDTTFLGILDLSSPSVVLAVLAGVTQFIQTKTATPSLPKSAGQNSKSQAFSKIMQKQMLYFLPAFTVLILWRLPSAIGLYWIVTSVFTIGQQYLMLKVKDKTA